MFYIGTQLFQHSQEKLADQKSSTCKYLIQEFILKADLQLFQLPLFKIKAKRRRSGQHSGTRATQSNAKVCIFLCTECIILIYVFFYIRRFCQKNPNFNSKYPLGSKVRSDFICTSISKIYHFWQLIFKYHLRLFLISSRFLRKASNIMKLNFVRVINKLVKLLGNINVQNTTYFISKHESFSLSHNFICT